MKTDSELKKDVLAELSQDPLVPESRVGVSVSQGAVTLSGHLDTDAQKVATWHAAARVSGVKTITLELEVIPSSIHQRNDTEIAESVQ